MILETQDLKKDYQMGDVVVHALKSVNFQVKAGEFVAIMGPSGSGKSTLLHLMGGLDNASGGNVILNGKPLANLSDDDISAVRRRQIGFIFQFFNLLPTLSAAENVALPLLIDGRKIADYKDKIEKLLNLVGLGDRMNHRPDQLSGGQQQRVAIARALATSPAIVLADEPTGNLDSQSGEEVLQLLRKMRDEQGQTVVMVTHNAHAAAFADRVVYLKDGEIVRELSAEATPESGKRATQAIRAVMTELENETIPG